jgi:cytidylate kinase
VPCRAVCISRAEGAGGAEIGHHVADRLGFRYVDDEIIAQAAAKGGISPGDVADEEKRKSTLGRLLREIGASSAVESYGLGGAAAELSAKGSAPEAIRSLIQEAIEETAGRGDVVIVAHAASRALAGQRGVLRVLVTASPEIRAERLSQSSGIDRSEATRTIKESDAARRDYLRRFYGVDVELPTHYDLVVSTDALSIEQATELIAQAAAVIDASEPA